MATKQFNLGRGVRQGCPLSGILFTIGIEILANAITSTSDIKGIEINDAITIKLRSTLMIPLFFSETFSH